MDDTPSSGARPLGRGPRTFLASVAVLCLAGAVILLSKPIWALNHSFFDSAIALLVVGWLLTGSALTGWLPTGRDLADRARRARTAIGRHRVEAVALIFLLAAAAVLRIAPLGEIPPPDVLWYEEPQTGEVATRILTYGDRPLDYPLVNYGVALSFLVFGTSTTSLKIPCIVIGLLTVLLVFATARSLFRPGIAFFVTAMFAVSRWHIHLNHVADENAPPLLLMMTILFLLTSTKGEVSVGRGYLLGTLLGAVVYVYAGYRFLLVAVPLVILARWVIRLTPLGGSAGPASPIRARAFVGIVLGLLIAAAPLIVATATGDPRAQILVDLDRDHSFGIPLPGSPEWDRATQVATTVFRFIFSGLSCEWVSAGGKPAMEPVAAVLSLLGFGWAVVTLWRPGRAFLAFWTLVVALAGTVIIGHTYLHRLCPIVPMLYLLIGFPLDDLGSLIGRLQRSWPARVLAAALVVVVAVEAMANLDTIYRQYPSVPHVRNFFEERSLEQPIRAQRLAGDGEVHLWSDLQDPDRFYHFSDLSWLTGIFRGQPMASPFDTFPVREPEPPDRIVASLRTLHTPFSRRDLDMMAGFFYPEIVAEAEHAVSPSAGVRSSTYILPGSVVEAHRGLSARFAAAGADPPVSERRWVDRMDGSPLSVASGIWEGERDIRWTGLAWLETGGDTTFRFEGADRSALRINGWTVFEQTSGRSAIGTVRLERGWHTVELVATAASSSSRPRLLAGPAGFEPAPLPPEHLHAVDEIRGLRRTWIAAEGGEERVVEQRIEPTVSRHIHQRVISRIRTLEGGAELARVRWDGWWTIDEPIETELSLWVLQGGARLSIDGAAVVDVSKDQACFNRRHDATFRFEEGAHRFTLIYDCHPANEYFGGVELLWNAGGGTMRALPVDQLSPIPPPSDRMESTRAADRFGESRPGP
jgi:hypothetical protein